MVRDDFDPERSDVDVLVEYREPKKVGLSDLIHAEQEPATIFGRKVDLADNIRETLWPYVKDDLVLEYVEES